MSGTALSGSGTSLYVGDLHKDVNEANLFDLFKHIGPIISIRVCRDLATRMSLGYAYVNFQNPVDAQRAIETHNFEALKDKQIRIMWSQRDPSVRKSGVGNVFIKGLEKSVDTKVLYDTFSSYGNILSCKVVTDDQGNSKGYGFVHYDGEEPAKKAIEALDGTDLRGSTVFVGPFIKRSQRQSGLLTRFTNVYIKEIKSMDAQELKEKMQEYGEVTSSFTKVEPTLEKCFGFVNFASHEQAVKAIDAVHGQEVEGLTRPGSKTYMQRAMRRAERDMELRRRFLAEKAKRQFPPANNLYVKNLDDVTNEEQLRALFELYGEITSCVVMKDHSNAQPKGFGFVCFKEAAMAQKALAEMNGKLFGDKPLYVNIAQKKDARRSMLELQYAQRRHMPPHAFMPPQPAPGFYNQMYWAGGKGGKMGPPPMGPPMGPMRMMGGKGFRGGMKGGMRGGRGGKGAPRPQEPMQAPVQHVHVKEGGMDYGPALTSEALAALASLPQDEQKNALGEQLWMRINKTHPGRAEKITGMLLEMDVSETLNLLESPDVLQNKIEEALSVLEAHEAEQEKEE
eukprot:TRINITY_DN5614_c0_g2_i1.p1 TRINITY_DN5614_c0_g2~~TRINITY_DN5614_c0_g2_i1.p1  ORF type:complete len:566 (+),score=296.40 TRINITY_DN5614_c0_g2_i1:87-1784(+)